MTKSAIIRITIFATVILCAKSALSQNHHKQLEQGFGIAGGYKSTLGLVGGFYNLESKFSKISLNTKFGIGYSSGVVANLDVGFSIFRFEKGGLYFISTYSHHFPGKVNFENEENQTAYFSTGNHDYLHFGILSRIRVENSLAIQFNVGYRRLISPLNYSLESGNASLGTELVKNLESGVMVELGAVVYPWR